MQSKLVTYDKTKRLAFGLQILDWVIVTGGLLLSFRGIQGLFIVECTFHILFTDKTILAHSVLLV